MNANEESPVQISPEEVRRLFDEGETDLTPYLDRSSTRRLNERRRVHVDLPDWMIDALDQQARRTGVSRQAVIKMWMAERLRAPM